MLARTASLAIVASLAAVVFASPLPGGGDGQDIKFIEIKAIDDDKFKKTNFNVHDAAEHDANFNQVEAKDKDALKAVVFKKNDNDFGIFKRADIFANSLDLREAAGFSFDLDLKNELNLDTDLNFDRFRRSDISDDILFKRWDRDGENIKFAEIKAIDEDKFKKTKFNVHDATEHDANFNQVEAKDKDALKAVVFKKNDDDFGIFKRGIDIGLLGDDSFGFGGLGLGLDSGLGLDDSVDSSFFDSLIIFKRDIDSSDDVSLAKRWDRDGEDIKFAEIKAIDEDKFKKTNFNVHDRTEHDKNFNQVEAKDKDVLKATAFRKNDNDDGFKHRRFRGGKFGGGKFGDDW